MHYDTILPFPFSPSSCVCVFNIMFGHPGWEIPPGRARSADPVGPTGPAEPVGLAPKPDFVPEDFPREGLSSGRGGRGDGGLVIGPWDSNLHRPTLENKRSFKLSQETSFVNDFPANR